MSDVLSSPNGPDGFPARGLPTQRNSTLLAAGAVVALHAAIIAAILLNNKPPPIKEVPARIVTATLIAPEPAPVPVARPEPPKAEQKPVVKPPPPKPVMRKPTPHPTSTPTPVAATPPEPAPPPTPATPAPTPPAPAPAPAPAIDPNVPKNVRHLTCAGTRPEYPALSSRRGETGTVVIQFVVDTHGKVESARVKTSSGYDRLDEAARQAALSSPCTPYMEGGTAVKAITERPYSFSLSD
ncbi:energy transducer TonB [Robbsia andropogonis]|uniref:energy transducer TonB n=2 Tax=Robbsia andropogonis TaxID=28092 RepID=UPI000697541C|nr:energy transducer TonB [Robbsia andropogonis]MCP1116833.1 TonB family protein [Robbsia andropogonis]MCP1126488.1 TonB family protein [Robbsia andropogonis]